MKTKLLTLLLILIVLSSCNTARNYANYRFGGESEKENNISTDTITKTKPEVVVEVMDSILPQKDFKNEKVELPQEEFSANKKSESTSLKKVELKINKCFPKITRAIKILPTINPLTEKDSLKQKRKDSLYYKNSKKEIKASDVLDTFIEILLVASLIFTVVTYLASVNFAIADVILIALAIGLGILLCIGLGKLIMGMFPGMSKKKKTSIKNFLDKISFVKRRSKSGMKYYGGMTVKEYFWIGMGVIVLAFIGMAIFGATDLAWSIIMGLLGIHLVVCAMAALVVGFLSLFPGMNLKK